MKDLKILFLGYNKNETSLIHFLTNQGYKVVHKKSKVDLSFAHNFDFIISFGYRFIIKKDIISFFAEKIINLHISYLPFGRGSHPVFWSFVENHPKGVSIHLIEEKLDQGRILVQKTIKYNKNETTFKKVYKRSIIEIQKLFIQYHEDILNCNIKPKKQVGLGTYHKKSDLPNNVDWNMNIKKYLKEIN